MARIGTFTQKERCFFGRLQTFSLDVALCILPIQPTNADNAPDYRIHLGQDGRGLSVGVGWSQRDVNDVSYIKIVLDDPTWGEPIRAILFASKLEMDRGKGIHYLDWSHASRRRWAR